MGETDLGGSGVLEDDVDVLEEDVTNDPELRRDVVVVRKATDTCVVAVVENEGRRVDREVLAAESEGDGGRGTAVD